MRADYAITGTCMETWHSSKLSSGAPVPYAGVMRLVNLSTIFFCFVLASCASVKPLADEYSSCGLSRHDWQLLPSPPGNSDELFALVARRDSYVAFYWFSSTDDRSLMLCGRSTPGLSTSGCFSGKWGFEPIGDTWRDNGQGSITVCH